ncbi:cholesterol esterase [Rhizina undulata]
MWKAGYYHKEAALFKVYPSRLSSIPEVVIELPTPGNDSPSRRIPRGLPRETMPVPFVGRLYLQEYIALGLSFLFLLLESVLRVITLALPAPIINFCYSNSRTLFNALSPKRHTTVSSTPKEKDIVARIREADGFLEICEIWNDGNLIVEEHVVQTRDGYLLGLHRLRKKDSNDDRRNYRGRGNAAGKSSGKRERANAGKKVVYLHHGLLMNSEVFVCQLAKERSLPFVLVEKGFDVWLGNNRGNKYSKKSIHNPSSSAAFWNFSMDEFAFYDIPDSISYILDTTKQKSLSYIGFSQGTAQAFATLSIHPALNEQIDLFIALAPAMSPEGLSNPIVDALMKTSPNIMFLFFGRKSILSSTTFWQSILYPPIFVRLIDVSLRFLFNWTGNNISLNQKIAAYSHLYSFTSVKSVVHWFQIIRNKSFQMYDDDIQTSVVGSFTGRNFYKVAKFPTRNITTPIVLVYGGSDSLVDIDVMLKELPHHTVAIKVDHYEHLDFLWGDDTDKLVFPHVLKALETYSFNNPVGVDKETSRAGRHVGDRSLLPPLDVASARVPNPPTNMKNDIATYSEDERSGCVACSPRSNASDNSKLDSRNPYGIRSTGTNTSRPFLNSPTTPPMNTHNGNYHNGNYHNGNYHTGASSPVASKNGEHHDSHHHHGSDTADETGMRRNQRRSASISSTFSNSSVGSAGGKGLISAAGIVIGTAKPSTSQTSAAAVSDSDATRRGSIGDSSPERVRRGSDGRARRS